MIRALLLLPFVLAMFSGCAPYGPPVHFVVPNGFTGEIRLILDQSGGTAIERIDGKYTYRVPPSGVLRVRSFKPFRGRHVQTAAYESGNPIPQAYETWTGPNGEKSKLGKSAVVFQGGGISQHNDELPVMTYFVGSTLDYEEWQRQKNSFLTDIEHENRQDSSVQSVVPPINGSQQLQMMPFTNR